jgi:uncharacterized membrane protein
MPFFGFFGGFVLATLVLVVVADRRIKPPGQRLNLATLPRIAFLLFAAYAALFAIMWMYFFANVLGQVQDDYPAASYALIFRSFFRQMERWDFIVTLLAFIAGGLLVLAADRAAGSGNRLGLMVAPGAPNHLQAPPDPPPDGDGVVAASLRQLKRITALNLLLVFALILVTMPALLPWVERRLDVVKLGSFEARLAPLAENTRRTSMPDTPSLATQKDLSNFLRVSGSIERVVRVLEVAPAIAGNSRDRVGVADFRRSYELAQFFFDEEIIPRVVRMMCLSKVAGIGIPDVPGARESASALLSALQEVRTRGTPNDLHRAVASLGKIDQYYAGNFSHIGFECFRMLSEKFKGEKFVPRISAALFAKDPVTPRNAEWDGCLSDWQARGCREVIRNGYTIRFILEFAKLSSRDQGSVALFNLLKAGMLDDKNYADFNPTEIDNFNFQILKVSYLADAQVMPSELIEEYAYLKAISARMLEPLSEACGTCPTGRRPKAKVEDEYETYRMLAEWFVDADAVITVGSAMLRRMPLNKLHESDMAALKKLLISAIRSRDEIQDPDAASGSSRERWAAAMLDEGIATIRYVQLAEAPDSLGDDPRAHCNAAKARLESAVDRYKLLQWDDPEHRINRMRAERTLVLLEQHCS